MKVIKFTEGREEWLTWRLGRSTGSKAADLFSRAKGMPVFNSEKPKIGVYRLIAEGWIGSAALAEEDASIEKAHERGSRLEPEAIARFNAETGKKMQWHNDDIGWEREDDPRIAYSPDGSQGKTEAAEAKCLSAARHMQALIEQVVPEDYEWQALKAFVTNDSLRTLYFIFFDPRFPAGLDFFYLTIKRKDKKADIEALLSADRQMLDWVRMQTADLGKHLKAPVAGAPAIAEEEKPIEMFPKETPLQGLARVAAGIKERSL